MRTAECWVLLLALRAIVRPPPGDDDFPDRSFARHTWFAFAAIGTMLDLKEAGLTICVHIVRDRRSAGDDSRLQNPLERCMQFAQLGALQRVGPTTRPDVGAKQRFVSIDIPHSVQQL